MKIDNYFRTSTDNNLFFFSHSQDLDVLQEKSRLYAKEITEHNHDVFSNLHSLLQTIEEEHEENIKNIFLKPLEIIENSKKILLETNEILENDEIMNESLDTIITDLTIVLTVVANFNEYLESNLIKLKVSNLMENPLRMLFDGTMKCNPMIVSPKFINHNEYIENDVVVFENSFYGSGYDEHSNESSHFKQDMLSNVVRKTRTVSNKSSTFERDYSPTYVPQISQKSTESFPVSQYRKNNQTRTVIQNSKSQIVQIVSAHNLCSIMYKPENSTNLQVCALYNMTLLSASNIIFQKDLIRYFLLK